MVQVSKKVSLLYRSRIDIIANILQVAEEGTRKTHIMYRCNLSFRQMNAYLEFLTDMGFLENSTAKTENKYDPQLFKTTRKGNDFVKAYQNLKVFLV